MNKKSKKVGICHRYYTQYDEKDKPRGELYLTEGALKAAIRSALRKLWTSSVRRIFIESVRFEHDFGERVKYAVKCGECDKLMSISERTFAMKKDGTRGKIKRLLYEVDHIDKAGSMVSIDDELGEWAMKLFYGPLQVLCRECHGGKTYGDKSEVN